MSAKKTTETTDTGYAYSRAWFDFCFENTDLINPNHTALYFFIIEHRNRLGWKEKFGLPMQMAKDAIGIKNYRTYSNTFKDLVEWGFIKIIQESKNQYSANVIALVKNAKATTKALDKAMHGHLQKHSQKQVHGIVGIDKPLTLEPLTNNHEQVSLPDSIPPLDDFLNYVCEKYEGDFSKIKNSAKMKYTSWVENNWHDGKNIKIVNWKTKILNTIPHLKVDNGNSNNGNSEKETLGRTSIASIKASLSTKSIPDNYRPGDFERVSE